MPTKTGKDAWPPNSIAGILDNPFYKGELTWGRQQVLRDENGKPYLEQRREDDPGRVTRESPLGAIVDPELWDRVNARRLAARGQKNRNQKATPENVLDGIVFCGRCGHRMYTRIDNPRSHKTVRIRFYCPGKRPGMVPRTGYSPCEKVNTILADNIIKGIASQPIRGGKTVEVQVTRGVAADADAEKKRDRLQARIREAEAEWANAKRLAVKGLLEDDDVAAVKAETEAIISEARTTLEELDQAGRVEVVPFTGTVADRFAELVDGWVETLRSALEHDGEDSDLHYQVGIALEAVGDLEGAEITTIEGIDGKAAAAVQAAWNELDVPQCGYCQSGQIMTAAAFLTRNNNPNQDDIDTALKMNICRCGTYQRIRKAVIRAAEETKDG